MCWGWENLWRTWSSGRLSSSSSAATRVVVGGSLVFISCASCHIHVCKYSAHQSTGCTTRRVTSHSKLLFSRPPHNPSWTKTPGEPCKLGVNVTYRAALVGQLKTQGQRQRQRQKTNTSKWKWKISHLSLTCWPAGAGAAAVQITYNNTFAFSGHSQLGR